MPEPPPRELRTARLVLRIPRLDDAPAIFEGYAQDPEVTRYLCWPPHRDLAVTQGFVRGRLAAWEQGHDLTWAITRPGEDRCLGMIGIRLDGFKADIGYVLARAFWGHGLMSEAARAVADWGLSLPAVYRVWAMCDVDNRASARVLEKCGMNFEGVLHRFIVHPAVGPEPRDCRCYARVR